MIHNRTKFCIQLLRNTTNLVQCNLYPINFNFRGSNRYGVQYFTDPKFLILTLYNFIIPDKSNSNLHSVSLSTSGSSISKHGGIAAVEDSRDQRVHFPVEDTSNIVVLLGKEGV